MQIEFKKVAKHKKKLVWELRKNMLARVALFSSILAVGGYTGYKFFLSSLDKPNLPSVKTDVSEPTLSQLDSEKEELFKFCKQLKKLVKESEKTTAEFAHIARDYKTLLAKYGYEDGAPQGLYAWAKSWGQYIGTQYLLIGISSVAAGTLSPFTKYFSLIDKVLDSLSEKLFYEPNLAWYLSTHTNLPMLYKQMKRSPLLSTESDESSQDFLHHRTQIAHTWNLYVSQVEAVLGFMEYKIELFAKQSSLNEQRGHNIIKYVVRHVNNVVPVLRNVLQTSTVSGKAVKVLRAKLAELHGVVETCLDSFAEFERLLVA